VTPLWRFLAQRTLSALTVLLVVAVMVFSLMRLTLDDPAAIIAGDSATSEQIQQVREGLGLDRPLVVQFGLWFGDVLHGNLGESFFYKKTVLQLISQRLEPTLALALCTIVIAVIVAVPAGAVAAWYQGGWLDRALMSFSTLGFSIPVFVLGYLLIWLVSLKLRWLPVQGYDRLADGLTPFLRRLILPSITLSLVYIALIARVTRAAVSEALTEDFVRTARAKGLPEWRVMVHHALANAAVPIVTVIGIGLTLLLSGVVVTERVFSIPGLGQLTVEAVLNRDFRVVQAVILLFSAIYVVVNFLIDLSYLVLDPRIRY
jgi:peptide/nickel transport system permease protein